VLEKSIIMTPSSAPVRKATHIMMLLTVLERSIIMGPSSAQARKATHIIMLLSVLQRSIIMKLLTVLVSTTMAMIEIAAPITGLDIAPMQT